MHRAVRLAPGADSKMTLHKSPRIECGEWNAASNNAQLRRISPHFNQRKRFTLKGKQYEKGGLGCADRTALPPARLNLVAVAVGISVNRMDLSAERWIADGLRSVASFDDHALRSGRSQHRSCKRASAAYFPI
jgi:hypothetical protein